MTARCRACGRYWIISIKHPIPHAGCICPYCSVRDKLIRAGIIRPATAGGKEDAYDHDESGSHAQFEV